jgi:hypothetical protein
LQSLLSRATLRPRQPSRSPSSPRPLPLLSLLCTALFAAEPLPNTQPLEAKNDLAVEMVEELHQYLDREFAASAAERDKLWGKLDVQDHEKQIEPRRERFQKMLGLVDERVKFNDLEYLSGPRTLSLILKTDPVKVHAVRWRA